MKPIHFPETNVMYGRDQSEYLPLPAFTDFDKLVVHCWYLSFWERVKLLFTGRLWITVFTFNEKPQPIKPQVNSPFIKIDDYDGEGDTFFNGSTADE